MSRKNSNATSDLLRWSDAINLINKLERDHKWNMVTFILISVFFGTRVGDTLQITWNQLLNDDLTPKAELIILERKTKKIRKIQISNQLGRRIAECYNQIKPTEITDNILISNKKTVFSIQRLNVILKELKIIYKIDIQNFSCHSLRKCFAREIYDKGNKSEYMLLKLSIILNHSSIAHTRRYIGIQDVEIADAYNLLTF